MRVTRVEWQPAPTLRAADELGRAASERAAGVILDRAQDLVPYRTGALAASGHVADTADGAAVVYDADYAVYVRARGYALGGRSARWLDEAVAQTRDEAARVYEDTFRSGWPRG